MRSPPSAPRPTLEALLIAVSFAAASRHVDAQFRTCSTIQPGDTVARVAARITGDARNRHSAMFQIVDPDTGRIIAKSQYDRIQAGWQACVEQTPIAADPREALAGSSAAADYGRLNLVAFAIRDSRVVLVVGVGLVVAAVPLCIALRAYLTGRRRTLDTMTGFGVRFVREFERPLIQPVPQPRRIRSRLRARPGRKRLDILLAPGGKGRYPNLSDHKDNVMYDVVRVVRLLRNQSFACGPPYAEGEWVVVPFQFKGWSKQAGGQ